MTMNPLLYNASSLRRLLIINSMGNQSNEYTATGNPATFTTNVAKDLRQLLIPFSPVQSGTGDPSPENIRPITGWTGFNVSRTGKNLLDPAKKTSSSSTVKRWYAQDGFLLHKDIVYKVSASTGHGTVYIVNHATGQTIVSGSAGKAGLVPTEDILVYFQYYHASDSGSAKLMLEVVPSTDTPVSEFEDYVGTTIPVVFPAVGKNLFDKAHPNIIYGNFDYNNNVIDEYDDQRFATVWIPCEPNTTYTASKVVSKRFIIGTSTETTLADGSYIDSAVVTGNTKSSLKITTGADTKTLWVYLYNSDAGDTSLQDILDTLQIEEGSSATTYEPFTNTVYGGTLDLTTGVLTSEWRMVTIDASRTPHDTGDSTADPTWSWASYRISPGSGNGGITTPDDGDGNGFCNVAMWKYGAVVHQSIAYYRSGYLYVAVTAETSLYNMKTAEGRTAFFESIGGTIYVVYKLANPKTYQLTPQQIQTLIGDNVIWSDTNGENTIKYLKKG